MAIKQNIDDGPPKECRTKHPQYEGVTCVRIGECWGGTPHVGILTNPRKLPGEQRRFVYWGGRSMEMDRNA